MSLASRIAGLSPEKRALLLARLGKGAVLSEGRIPRRNASGPWPLSFSQQRLWFLNQLNPGAPAYNIGAAVKVTGAFDVAVLERALNEVVRRHPVLRVRLETVEGQPVQAVLPDFVLHLKVDDFAALSSAKRERAAIECATSEIRRPFDLAKGPLIRAAVFRLSDTEYILVLTLHHLAADGWSIGILLRELTSLYSAFLAGRLFPLPVLELDYGDYAEWQRKRLDDPAVAAPLLEYWKSRLGTGGPPLALPTDRSRPPVQTFHGARLNFTLVPELSRALLRLAAGEGVTPSVLFLAAFAVLLYRHANQDEVSIGTPSANRASPEIAHLVGFFVNTLVIRTSLADDPGFRQLLARMRDAVLGAEAHQELPFEMLVDELRPARDPSRTPLFQAAFVLDRDPLEGIALPGTKLEMLDIEPGTAKFDLTLFMQLSDRGLSGSFEYNTDLFDHPAIRRMIGHFQTLIEAVAADPDRRVSSLDMLSAGERAQIIREWNRTAVPLDAPPCAHQLFEAQVERTPDAVAAVCGEERTTFRELDARANRVAAYLRARGVGPESLVGVCMRRSIDLVACLIGVWKAGGAYVPIDPAYPAERQQFMIEDAGVELVLTSLPQEPGGQTAGRGAGPSNLAYVIYTSGSTGTPKGAMITHGGLVNYLEWCRRAYPLSGGNGSVVYSSIAFDLTVTALFAPLVCGRPVILLDDELAVESLGAVLRQTEDLSLIKITPAHLELLGRQLTPGQARTATRAFIIGGENLLPEQIAFWQEHAPGTALVNEYGPTETVVGCCVYTAGAEERFSRSVPIGRPIINTRLYILDSRWQPVPVAVAGELYIGGAGVARGYLGRPDLTAERFIPDPFSGEPGARLYRTGDLARYRPDGNIECLGRVDHQVKVRGFRVELGEVEAALAGHPEVGDAAVVFREGRLIAYVVSAPDSVPAIRAALARRLPDYMLPSVFVALDALPLTPHGKVDRKALPSPDADGTRNSYLAPRTPLERQLAELWSGLLKVERIGVYDNFFELGGHSIQAAIFINRLQEQFKLSAHVRAIFMAPTVAELAAYINEYFPDAAARLAGDGAAAGEFQFQRDITGGERVTRATVAEMRRMIPPLAPIEDTTPPNPRAMFVLSPPRSGSTLLRAMLAGHPRLFSPPELDLLSFNSLDERRAAFEGKHAFWLEGPIRAIMEITGCDSEYASRLMADFEDRKLTTKAFYRQLQEWLGDRLLVDKTPVYPLDGEILKRAEHNFEDTLYIHLVRHPYASVYSFVEAKLDGVFFRHKHPFSPRALAELVWIVCHQNILEFLAEIPRARQHRISYEDLVTDPRSVMEGICAFAGIEFTPEMLEPYRGRRMTDGVRPGAQMVGDFKFYLRKEIDPKAADRWKKFHNEDFLSDVAWEVAARLGYAQIESRAEAARPAPQPIPRVAREGNLPLSCSQERLWFLDQLEPGSPAYNVPAAIRLTGDLEVETMVRSLEEIVRRHEALRTRFPSIEGKAVQVIEAEARLDFSVVDLGEVPAEEREREALRRAREFARLPFDLEQGPLLRSSLLHLRDRDHLAVLAVHHIVADGWSTGVLIRELAALYEAFREGRPSPLPGLPVQYADFAAWQRRRIEERQFETDLAYWRQQLAGCDGRIRLPLDHPRPAVQTWNGGTVTAVLPESLSDELQRLSHSRGATLFMTLLAGFQALLHRYSGQDDIAVGTPVANRSRVELEPLIGFFVNTLVMRTRLDGDPTFTGLLDRVRETAAGAFAHQDAPFEKLVEKLEPDRDLSTSPLFEVMFVLQNAPFKPLELPGLSVCRAELDTGTAKIDLVLTVAEQDGVLRLVLEYNSGLFERATAERLLSHYINLLTSAVSHPERPVSRLQLLADAERHSRISEWNSLTAPLPEETIHRWIEKQAAIRPAQPALVFEEQRVTYAELNRRADKLASELRMLGVGPDVRAAVCVERSVEMIVALLAVLKAGGAYVPIDPSYPPARRAYILEDCGAAVVLASTPRLLTAPPLTPITHHPSPTNLAYVIYTSGSTGKPKGVLVEHRSLCNLVAGQIEKFRVTPESRVLQFASFSFDASVSEIFVTLAAGATLYLGGSEVFTSPDDLMRLLRKARITVATLPPSLLSVLPSEELPDLETLVSAGEVCPSEVAKRWGHGRRFINAYGPTECTVGPAYHEADLADLHRRHVPIGRPIANVQVYLLDRNLEPLPAGAVGEICVAGAGLARGYLGRPDLTAERFIPNPFSHAPGARLYRTGDLGRYLPDGSIEYLGRIDDQVKLRGFRVEPGEIEAALRACPGVTQAAAIVREDAPGDHRLVAYYSAADPVASASELRAALSASLPDYMVPSRFVRLDALPLTPNGKVDRRALPAPEAGSGERERGIPPRTLAEERLAAIWQQVLGVEQIGIHDNFFELGGDSILSIQVVARAREAGFQFTPKQLFQNPTVAGLASLAGSNAIPSAEQGHVEGPVPPTPIMLWFLEQQLPEPHHWNQSVLLRVTEPLDVDRLRAAVVKLMEHHDALRLRLGAEGWVNAAPQSEAPFESINLAGRPAAEQEAALVRKATQLQTGLDLHTGPLMRVAYFDLGAGCAARLLIVIHHAAVDGVSWRILLEDLQRAYRGEPLPPKTTSYREWARRLNLLARTDDIHRELDFWVQMQPAAAINLPVDHVGQNTEASTEHVTISLGPDETEALLRGVPAAHGTEITDALLTALGMALREWTGSQAVLVDLEGHGREPIADDVDVSRTVGWFTSLFPIKLDLGQAAGISELLRHVKDQLRRIPNRGIGYGLLRYMNGHDDKGHDGAERLRRLPQPQISFNYLGQFDRVIPENSPFAPATEPTGPAHSPRARRAHLIDVSGGVSQGCLRFAWIYSSNVHERVTIERVANSFAAHLRELAALVASRTCAAPDVSDADLDLALEQLG